MKRKLKSIVIRISGQISNKMNSPKWRSCKNSTAGGSATAGDYYIRVICKLQIFSRPQNF